METVEQHPGATAAHGFKTGSLRIFLTADACYLLLVFGWMLAMRPLGRDFPLLARPDRIGPVPGALLAAMMRLFGGWAPGYMAVNLALLFGCMALLILLTRRLTLGPWWLGSVAAVLFMANPIKTEAVLSFAGVGDLLTGFLALLCLQVYAWSRDKAGRRYRLLPLGVYLAGVLITPDLLPMFLVLVPFEWTFFRKIPGCGKRLRPIVIVGLIAFLISGRWALPGAFSPARVLVPLYLVLYPLGMLPGNVAFFGRWPLLGAVCAVVVLAAVLGLMRKINHPLVTFGLLGALAWQLLQGHHAVDPVTLENGGKMLVPAALIAVAAAGLFHAMMHHPRWRPSVVRLSTLLCVAAMLCQGWVNWHWLQAGRLVSRFQAAAAETARQHPGRPLALVPDLHHVGTAPVYLGQAVRHNTPFSTSLPVIALAEMSVYPPVDIQVESHSRETSVISVGRPAVPPMVRPRPLSQDWWRNRYRSPDRIRLELRAREAPFPEAYIPYP